MCHECGSKMHVHGTVDVNLTHIPMAAVFSAVRFEKKRYKCPACGRTEMEYVMFQADGHRITNPLLDYTTGLLEIGLPLKTVASITGLGKNTVKDIDKKRLEERFTELCVVLFPTFRNQRHVYKSLMPTIIYALFPSIFL